MACPYFFPIEPIAGDLWPHPGRLPLGAGWRGTCTADGSVPGNEDLARFCNLGYARTCPRLPANPKADAVRFGVAQKDGRIRLFYVCERAHRPGESGTLEFDAASGTWLNQHSDSCIQRMAECFVSSRCSCKTDKS